MFFCVVLDFYVPSSLQSLACCRYNKVLFKKLCLGVVVFSFRFVLVLFLCMQSLVFAEDSSPAVVTLSDANQTIEVTPANPEFEIRLSSDTQSAFQWYLLSYDSHWLTPLGQSFSVAGEGSKALSYESWSFKADKAAFRVPSASVVKFVYAKRGAVNLTQRNDEQQMEFTVVVLPSTPASTQ